MRAALVSIALVVALCSTILKIKPDKTQNTNTPQPTNYKIHNHITLATMHTNDPSSRTRLTRLDDRAVGLVPLAHGRPT